MDYTSNPTYYQYAVRSPQAQNPNPNFQQQQTSVYYADPNLNTPAVDPNSYAYGAAATSYGLCSYYPDPNAQNWATYSDPNAQNWTAAQQPEANTYATGVAIPQNGTKQLVSKTSSVPTTTTIYSTTQRRLNNFRAIKKIKTTTPMFCDVCKIVCNTQDVFSKHRLGKKHKRNVEKLKASLQPAQPQYQIQPRVDNNAPIIGPPENPALAHVGKVTSNGITKYNCDVCKVVCDTTEIMNTHILGKKHKKKLSAQENSSVSVSEPGGTETIPSTESGFVSCEICKIVCNTKLVLEQHFQGKKHISKASKAAGEVAQASQPEQPSVTLANPNEDATSSKRQRKKSAADTKEDLEIKKRKLLESGVAADAAKTCLLCNVICNSDIVFNFHLHGARHNALVKKQASATATAAATTIPVAV
jgi:zinc finger RNA-binding protein